jgi:hypothetical protein
VAFEQNQIFIAALQINWLEQFQEVVRKHPN